MPRYRLICLQIADQQYHELPDGVRELIDHGMAVAGPGGLDVPVHAEANGGRAWSDGSGRLLVRHVAATAVVIGTEATSPMLPTSVRTISVATSSVVTMSPSAHPEMLKISIGGSEAPASWEPGCWRASSRSSPMSWSCSRCWTMRRSAPVCLCSANASRPSDGPPRPCGAAGARCVWLHVRVAPPSRSRLALSSLAATAALAMV